MFKFFFQCSVTVTDNGYPQPQLATVSLTVFISRDQNAPVFTQNAVYRVTIPETQLPNSSSIINYI